MDFHLGLYNRFSILQDSADDDDSIEVHKSRSYRLKSNRCKSDFGEASTRVEPSEDSAYQGSLSDSRNTSNSTKASKGGTKNKKVKFRQTVYEYDHVDAVGKHSLSESRGWNHFCDDETPVLEFASIKPPIRTVNAYTSEIELALPDFCYPMVSMAVASFKAVVLECHILYHLWADDQPDGGGYVDYL